MPGKTFELNGRALELLGSVRPGVDPRTLAKVAVHLDRMVRSGLPPESIRGAMSSDARKLLSVAFDESLGRSVVRSLLSVANEVRSSPSDARTLAARVLNGYHAPVVGSRQDKAFAREIDAIPPQAVTQRLGAVMGRPSSVAAISINPVKEGWLTYEGDSRPAHAHRDVAARLLAGNGFTVIPAPDASRMQLLRCQESDETGLLVVHHDSFTAHRVGVNGPGNKVVRDVRVGLDEAFAVDLEALAANLGTGADSIFASHADDANLLLAMAIDERDSTMISPISTSVVAEHYASVASS